LRTMSGDFSRGCLGILAAWAIFHLLMQLKMVLMPLLTATIIAIVTVPVKIAVEDAINKFSTLCLGAVGHPLRAKRVRATPSPSWGVHKECVIENLVADSDGSHRPRWGRSARFRVKIQRTEEEQGSTRFERVHVEVQADEGREGGGSDYAAGDLLRISYEANQEILDAACCNWRPSDELEIFVTEDMLMDVEDEVACCLTECPGVANATIPRSEQICCSGAFRCLLSLPALFLRRRLCPSIARLVSILVTIALVVGLIVGLGFAVYNSAAHVIVNWRYYQQGATELADWASALLKEYDTNSAVTQDDIHNLAQKVVAHLQVMVQEIIAELPKMTSYVSLTLLYYIFWILHPMHLAQWVENLVRVYLLYKTFSCALFGCSVYMLFSYLRLDFAPLFGALAFFLSFIPEVGPAFAIVLPVPMFLFDSRIGRTSDGVGDPAKRFEYLGISIVGQFILKCLLGNCLEPRLFQADKSIRIHPIIVMFSIVLFGFMWGPFGMLIAVPAIGVLKQSLTSPGSNVPWQYRQMVLTLLEGARPFADDERVQNVDSSFKRSFTVSGLTKPLLPVSRTGLRRVDH